LNHAQTYREKIWRQHKVKLSDLLDIKVSIIGQHDRTRRTLTSEDPNI
jgi:hypothetical protein